jgi:hypothetical protein
MTKTLNQIIFSLHQNQNICFSNIGNLNIVLEKNIPPPLQVKWSFPNGGLLVPEDIIRPVVSISALTWFIIICY